MNKIVTLAFSLIICLGSNFAQKIDYDNSSKWFLGFNLGGTWQTTDVENRTSVGYGFTLGKSFNYNYGKRMTFDLRARYLRGYWYGQNYSVDSMPGYNPTSQTTGYPLQPYKDSLGFAVHNFQSDVHRLSLELVLHANGVRERTGWDPYIFGGVGFTWYQTYADLYQNDSTGSIYGYDANNLTKPALSAMMDGIYDTPLDGSSSNKFTVGFMPSLGFGIGYQVGKRVTLGIEHKTTFTMIDQFDGLTSDVRMKNDLYHYTSAYINFRFRARGNGGGSTGGGSSLDNVNNYNQNNVNNLNNCLSPVISYVVPSTSGTTVSSVTYFLSADIKDVTGRENITFKQNGVSSLNFNYNPATDRFEANVVLTQGVNTFEITANNTCGTDIETTTVTYQQCLAPSVFVTNPIGSQVNVSTPSFLINADLYNVSARENIIFKHNGLVSNAFNYNPQTGKFESNVTLVMGVNSFEISVTNTCGTDTKQITVNYTTCLLPEISIQSPLNGSTVTSANVTLNGVILNMPNNQGISVKLNNRIISNFSFNTSAKTLQSTLNLIPGTNTLVITATNACGTDTETITINYQNCIAPEILVLNPSMNGTTVNTSNFTLNATVQNVSNAQSITLTHNTRSITNFSFNNGTGAMQSVVSLSQGANTFVITATNACGTDTETITINFVKGEDNSNQKITICHYPPGNTGNPQTLEIPLSAWPAHQAHGDKLGPCPVEENNGNNGQEQKITICHYPPGRGGNPQTLEIPLSAWPAHQAHGDKLGPCAPEDVNGGGTINNANGTINQQNEKITICHYPPGNNGNPQTLEIPLSAWPAHQAHGDKLGPCPVEENNGGNTGNNAPEEKITICHYPPGNNGNPQTLEIPLSAWPAHQAHGDRIGPCPVDGNNGGTTGQNGTGNSNQGTIPNIGGGNGNTNSGGNGNNGHGNNEDGVDVSNPGQGQGGPNGTTDPSGNQDDENTNGNANGTSGAGSGNTNQGGGNTENSGNGSNSNGENSNGSNSGNQENESNGNSGENGNGNGNGNSGGNKSKETAPSAKPLNPGTKKTETKPGTESPKPDDTKPQPKENTPAGRGKN